jgi:hypothetical protein
VDTLIVNMGYRYNAGAIVQVDDENLSLVQSPDWWTGQPGTRAPHIVLERQGKQISTLDLFGSHFVLLIGPEGQNWKDAARSTRTHSISLWTSIRLATMRGISSTPAARSVAPLESQPPGRSSCAPTVSSDGGAWPERQMLSRH